MKFSEIPYERPDVEHLKKELTALTDKIAGAATAEEQIAAFDRATALETDYVTLGSIAYVRNTINTADPFYDAEREYFDEIGPELSAVTNALEAALLDYDVGAIRPLSGRRSATSTSWRSPRPTASAPPWTRATSGRWARRGSGSGRWRRR